MEPNTSNNIIVLDLETAFSAEDCISCHRPEDAHFENKRCNFGVGFSTGLEDAVVINARTGEMNPIYQPIGWNNKAALGLSIGGYYYYGIDRVVWFDETNLESIISRLVEDQALMVSFNGIQFDFDLMHALLRKRANGAPDCPDEHLHMLCDRFIQLVASSYDIQAEIWRADPERKFERGLDSLDAILRANGLGGKLSHGAQAPRDWQAGKYADVINYCQDDILKTKALFELAQKTGGWIKRGDDNEIGIRWIDDRLVWREPVPF